MNKKRTAYYPAIICIRHSHCINNVTTRMYAVRLHNYLIIYGCLECLQ